MSSWKENKYYKRIRTKTLRNLIDIFWYLRVNNIDVHTVPRDMRKELLKVISSYLGVGESTAREYYYALLCLP